MHSYKNQSFLSRLRFACAGVAAGLRTEASLRWQFLAFVALMGVLLMFRPEPVWWALAILASVGVLVAELFNTAIELLADHLHPQAHASIRIVKDCAAAAVLVATAGSLAVGIALLIHLLGR